MEQDGSSKALLNSSRPRGQLIGTSFADKISHKCKIAQAHDAAVIECIGEKVTALIEGKNIGRGCLKK